MLRGGRVEIALRRAGLTGHYQQLQQDRAAICYDLASGASLSQSAFKLMQTILRADVATLDTNPVHHRRCLAMQPGSVQDIAAGLQGVLNCMMLLHGAY